MTKTNKIKAVKQVLTLVKNGATLTDARAIVANDLNVSSATIANWQVTFGKTITTARTDNRVSSPIKDYSFNDMSTDIRGVLKSVVDQDGRYTTREAGVIGKLYGAELSRAKLLLEVHKHNTKVSDTNVNNNILSLS